MSTLFHGWFAANYAFVFFKIIFEGVWSVSAVSLDVFQRTHCIVYSYCFLSCFQYLL